MAQEPVRRSTRIAALTGALMLLAGAVGLWLSSAQTQASPDGSSTASVARAPLPLAEAIYPVEPEALIAEPEPRREPTREEKRLARIDRNDDGRVQLAEFLAARRRNFDKRDSNGDGVLSFEEYAADGIAKFAAADANGDGVLSGAEYATTAAPALRKPTATAARQCPPCALADAGG